MRITKSFLKASLWCLLAWMISLIAALVLIPTGCFGQGIKVIQPYPSYQRLFRLEHPYSTYPFTSERLYGRRRVPVYDSCPSPMGIGILVPVARPTDGPRRGTALSEAHIERIRAALHRYCELHRGEQGCSRNPQAESSHQENQR